jgi:hypothetical protein
LVLVRSIAWKLSIFWYVCVYWLMFIWGFWAL